MEVSVVGIVMVDLPKRMSKGFNAPTQCTYPEPPFVIVYVEVTVLYPPFFVTVDVYLKMGKDISNCLEICASSTPSRPTCCLRLGERLLEQSDLRCSLASLHAASLARRGAVSWWVGGVRSSDVGQGEQTESRELERVIHLGGDVSDRNEASFCSESVRAG